MTHIGEYGFPARVKISQCFQDLVIQRPTDSGQIGANMDRTEQKIDTPVTSPRSGPVRYELVDKDGHVLERKFSSALAAGLFANQFWPDQEQDEDRAGNGWDVQLVGS